MNPVEKLVNKFGKYPRIISFIMGRTVKFAGTAGVKFDHFDKDRIVLSLRNREKVQNHIGQVHAMGMALLAETATGMMVGINIPKGKTPLLKSITCKYVRRSEGNIRVETNFDDERRKTLAAEDKGEVPFQLNATDSTGEVVAEFEAIWAWRTLKKS